jgi:hypothetical protein
MNEEIMGPEKVPLMQQRLLKREPGQLMVEW